MRRMRRVQGFGLDTLSMDMTGDPQAATLECELLDRTHFQDHHRARRVIFEFIEGWHNPHRRHQGLGQQSPMAFERSYQEAA